MHPFGDDAPHDLVGAAPVSGGQHDSGPQYGLARAVAIFNDRLEPGPIGGTQEQADIVTSHAGSLTDLHAHGNHQSDGEH